MTYRELAEDAAGTAAWLAAQGIAPGERVAIPGTNDPVFVASYLGVLCSGAIAVPLNPLSPGAEIQRELDLVEPVHVLGPGATAVTRDRFPPVERTERDPAALLFTVGTAGPPKAAVLTHGSLAANIRQVLGHRGLALRPDDVTLGVLPLFHVFGLNVGLGVPLAAGASVVLVDEFDPAAALALVRERGITVIAGVPTMWSAWLALPDDVDLRSSFASVRLAVSGAAALPSEVAEGLRERFGLSVHEGYGLTEASPIVTTAVLGGGPGTIGPPLPGVEVRIVDANGADVLAGDPGELWVRGPNVFAGYWNDPEATGRVLTEDGWLRTGDAAVVDDAGALRLVDRTKDLVIVSGFNVYPAEVEEVLLAHPDVVDVAVLGEPDTRTGEAVVAFVVAAPGRAPSEAALVDHCARSLARYKLPARVEVVDALPRSFAGKVLRRVLRGPERSEGRRPGTPAGE